MVVHADRCKASGDCRADAHNLAEISPQRLARGHAPWPARHWSGAMGYADRRGL